jgi:DNA-binding LacI/PurR family transcriptional regulator
MAELAQRAGVSISTVSRALAGSSVVNAETRDKIAALARELDFRPNTQARNLRLQRSHAIGVVLPLGHQTDQHLTDPFFLTMLGHLADAIADRGYDMLLTKVIPSDDLWLDRLVDSNRVDGVLIIGQSNQAEQIDRTAERYRRIVTWGAQLPGQHYVTVGTDNRLGGRLITQHLIDRGRRRLMFLGDPQAPEIRLREAGFRDACRAAGIEADATTQPAELVAERAYAMLNEFFAVPREVDGIVAASDVIAMAAIRAISEHGRAVPSDISVTGFDDVMLAAHTIPPLTTVRQDLQRGAALMVDALFALIGGDAAESVEMAPDIILRASS